MKEPIKTKRYNLKLIYMLVGSACFIFGFIFLITRVSPMKEANRKLQECNSVEEVQNIYNLYKNKLTSNNEFELNVRTKLTTFNLFESQEQACSKWLPPLVPNLNLIIVPDLSGRINDTINNPSQIINDKILLKYIWENFSKEAIMKRNSKDHFIIDVTGSNQVEGQFRTLADSLICDLSMAHGEANRKFLAGWKEKYSKNINKLYSMAIEKPQGADYWDYFNNDLNKNLKKSTLLDSYRNVIVIITDGYLEAQNKAETGVAMYTGGYEQRTQVFNKLKNGLSMEDALKGSISPIMDCQSHFKNLEVLLLEANPRHSKSKQEPIDKGTPQDGRILRTLWTDWFKRLEIKNASETTVFNTRFDANEKTLRVIDDFFGWR